MRSSAPEGPHAPRAKQAPPQGSSGVTAGPAGAPPPSRSQAPSPQLSAGGQRGSSQQSSTPQRGSPALLQQSSRVSSLQRSSSSSALSHSTPPLRAQQRNGNNSQSLQQQTLTSSSPQRSSVQVVHNSASKASSTPSGVKSSHSRSQSNQLVGSTKSQGTPPPTVKGGTAPSSSKHSAQSGGSKFQPSSNNPANFGEYDDQEWDVGVGHLIIDLDADIAQADRGRMSGTSSTGTASGSSNNSAASIEDKASIPKLKIKRTKPTKTSEAKHEIVKTDPASPPQSSSNAQPQSEKNSPAAMSTQQHNGAVPPSPVVVTPSVPSIKGESILNARTPTCSRSSHKKEKRRLEINGSSSPPPNPQTPQNSAPGTPNGSTNSSTSNRALQGTHLNPNGSSAASSIKNSSAAPTPTGTPVSSRKEHSSPQVSQQSPAHSHIVQKQLHQQNVLQNKPQTTPQQQPQTPVQNSSHQQPSQSTSNLQPQTPSQQNQQEPLSPAHKKIKIEEERKDACVGTSVGTITEPDCLGPCEPGSSVTLEGIVWHETEGGVLVVNVTWRGKTYVGTLLDCTKHDWAPPRFCDSPTSDLEARNPKGRAKRGRTAAAAAAAAAASSNSSTPNTPSAELSVAETRSGKLRNASAKNRRGGSSTPSYNAQPSPGKVESGGVKRKGKEAEMNTVPDAKNAKRSRSSSRGTPTNNRNSCSPPPEVPQPSPPQQSQENKDSRESPTPQNAGSPMQVQQQSIIIQAQETQPTPIQWHECPEANCNKKFRHENGLSYHQIHAHSDSPTEDQMDGNQAKTDGENQGNSPSPPPVTETPVNANSKDVVKPSVVRPPLISPVPVAVSVSNSELSESPSLMSYPPTTVQSNPVQVQITQSQPIYIYAGNNDLAAQQRQVPISINVGTATINSNPAVRHPSGSAPIQQVQPVQSLGNIPQGASLVNSQNPIEVQSLPPQTSSQVPPSPNQPQHIESRVSLPALPRQQAQPIPSQAVQQQIQTQPSLLLQKSPHQAQLNQHLQHQLNQQFSLHDSNSVNSPVLIPQQIQTPSRSLTQNSQPQSSFNSQPSVQQIHHPVRMELKPEMVQTRNPQDHVLSPLVRPPPPTSLNGPSEPINISTPNTLNVQPSSTIPQGTLLSSLPGNTPPPLKHKALVMPEGERVSIVKPKEVAVNGLSPKRDEEPPEREDARSPAYSDISDANDSAPLMDADDTKDFKEDKKPDHLAGQPPYAYGLYFGGYNQPPHPYLMSGLPPSSLPLKPSDIKDKLLDKDKKDGPAPIPVNSEFIKYPPQYLYNYPHLYPGNYQDPYLREPIYKELSDKAKLEPKECLTIDDLDRGPTDLSRSSQSSNPPDRGGPLNLKETKCDNPPPPLNKESPDIKSIYPEKRPPSEGIPYRYSSPYESRLPMPSPHIDKGSEPKPIVGTPKPTPVSHPSSLSSPRVSSTPPNTCNKEDKIEKRVDHKSEGVKPTMETTGPPPPPTSSSYYSHFPYGHLPFDPYRPQIVPPMSLTAAGFPPSYLPGHSPGIAGLRYPMAIPPPSGPEDLSRSSSGPANILPPPGLYSASHKMAELQERAQKSPNCTPSSALANKGGPSLSLGPREPLPSVGVIPSLPPHSLPPLSSPSPSSAVSAATVSGLHPSLMSTGERKTPPAASRLPPHPSLPDGYPYPLLPSQFPPTHFAALGMNQAVLPAVGVVGGSGPPPSAMGGGPLPK